MLDRRIRVIALDREAFAADAREDMMEHPGGLPTSTADCAVGAILRWSERELNEFLLGRGYERAVRITIGCDREAFERSLLETMRAQGFSGAPIRCERRTYSRLSDPELAEYVLDGVAGSRVLFACDRSAALAEYGGELRAAGYSDEEIDCVLGELRGRSNQALAEFAVERRGLDRVFEACT